MVTAQTQIVEDTIVVSQVPIQVNLGFIPTSFEFWNISKYSAAVANQIKEGQWVQALSNGELMVLADNGAGLDHSALMASGGIQPYDGSKGLQLGPIQTGTTSNKATGSFHSVAHGLHNGDVVLIYADDEMKQISGNFFGVSNASSSPDDFIIMNPAFLNTANFTNDTSFKFRKVITPVMFIPQVGLINMIDASNPIKVYTSVDLPLVPGMKVRLLVPSNFKMTQANELEGVITKVTPYVFGVSDPSFEIASIDASAFTAFEWPPVVALVPFTTDYPQVVPFGSGPFGTPNKQDLLDDQVRNQAFQGVVLGTGDGTFIMPVVGDKIYIRAIRADSNS